MLLSLKWGYNNEVWGGSGKSIARIAKRVVIIWKGNIKNAGDYVQFEGLNEYAIVLVQILLK